MGVSGDDQVDPLRKIGHHPCGVDVREPGQSSHIPVVVDLGSAVQEGHNQVHLFLFSQNRHPALRHLGEVLKFQLGSMFRVDPQRDTRGDRSQQPDSDPAPLQHHVRWQNRLVVKGEVGGKPRKA